MAYSFAQFNRVLSVCFGFRRFFLRSGILGSEPLVFSLRNNGQWTSTCNKTILTGPQPVSYGRANVHTENYCCKMET